MELELTIGLALDPKELAILDLHSFLNVVNVLATDLLFLSDVLGDVLEPALSGAYQLADSLRDGVDTGQALAVLTEYRELFFATLEKALAESPAASNPDVVGQVENLRSIWRIIDVRHAEMKARVETPAQWRNFSARELQQEFENFLGAVEKNSHGRYHIVSNIARKEPSDYVVYLDFSGLEGDTIVMPPVLKDVFRDLLANARKYTNPGGTIEAGISCDRDGLRLVIKDDGRGIPEDQLTQVVEFGFRARNVDPGETKGGGFGLTKAYWVTRQFRGRMWIASKLEEGTTITIKIPHPNVDA